MAQKLSESNDYFRWETPYNAAAGCFRRSPPAVLNSTEMKGVYVLVVELPEPAQVKTKRTAFDLDPGFYAYVGSALNNLEARIMRHLSNEKKRHWHIDYLLDRASVRAVVSAQSDTNAECLIAKGFSIMTQVARFGCSDCRCHSHLFHSLDLDDLKGRAVEAFRLAGLNPRTIKYP